MEQMKVEDNVVSPSQFMRQHPTRALFRFYPEGKAPAQSRGPVSSVGDHHRAYQTHDFELFCRKLCERTICTNLRPATGPEGGGDSKADTETSPVSDEISTLTFVGTANSGT